MSTDKGFKYSESDVENVNRYVVRHAECNSFAYDSDVILICVGDLAGETGIDRDSAIEILATNPICDSFLQEEFGRNMYTGPFFFDVLSQDTIVYCTPGSPEIARYSNNKLNER